MKERIFGAAKVGLVVLVVATVAMSGLALADSGDATQPATDSSPHDRRERGAALDILAGLTGLTTSEVAGELRSGASPAAIAEANGSTSDALVDGLVDLARVRVDTALGDGSIDAARADEIVARVTDRVADFVQRPVGERVRKVKFRSLLLDVLGLTPAQAAEAIGLGAAPLDLVRDAGFTADSFVDEAMTMIAAHTDDAIAAGRITQDEAAERLERAESRLRSWLDDAERPR